MIAAGPWHAGIMAALHKEAFAREERWSEQAFAAQLAQPGVFGVIAGLDGFVLACVAADEAEILTLAVRPEARRTGVAHRLMTTALARAAGLGAADMFLEVARSNAPARALYARLGFEQAGLRRAYYPDGDDALVLRRGLIPAAATAP